MSDDVLFQEILEYVIKYCDTVSTSILQRRFKIGYTRAVYFRDLLETYGIIEIQDGENPPKVILRDVDIIKKNIEKVENGKIDSIEEMSGLDFEKYAGEILKANGFEKIQVTKASGDYGVDIIAYKDEIKYAIQCKKYSSPVGIKAVQEVLGSKTMNDCHVAVVLTNNTFTNSAKELANKNNVLLWDNNKLNELIQNFVK